MPLEASLPLPAARVADLTARFAHHSAEAVLRHSLNDPMLGPIALVSSFGTEAVALLHMVAQLDRSTPVLFIDTEMLFPETLAYQRDVTAQLGLTDLRIIRPDRDQMFLRDPDGLLHRSDPNACCALRKTEPLQRALNGFESWITGRKRYQGAARSDLQKFELDGVRIKVNPLAHWSREDVSEYITNNRLPRHPKMSARLPSLGCAPCTSEVEPGEAIRAGRWRGQAKTECGIHFPTHPTGG